MTATLPGIQTTLVDNYSALRVSNEAYGDRVCIIGRTGSEADLDYAHLNEPRKYTSLTDVATVHGDDSELYEAFFHAQFAGCADIWLVPLVVTPAQDRSTELVTAYDSLTSIRPSVILPYGRGAKINISADGVVTRSVPTFGASPGFTDGAYANSTYGYLQDLADACEDLSTDERVCIGILGCEAIDTITPTGLVAAIGTEDSPGTLLEDLPTLTGDTGKFVSVVLGEVETAGMGPWAYHRGVATEFYRSNGALNYAGLVTNLTPPDAATNKMLNGISDIGFRLSRKQTLACIANNVVTLSVNNNVIRVDDAMTFASIGSDYTRLSTMRILAIVDDMVRRVGRKFIGKGMSQSTRDSLQTALGSGFGNLISAGILNEADFRVRFVGAEYTAYVDVVCVPAWELRSIQFTIQVSFETLTTSSLGA